MVLRMLPLVLLGACAPWPGGHLAVADRADQAALLLVTPEALAPSWASLASWREATGIPTRIVTVEEIHRTEPGPDTAARIRERIRRGVREEGTRWVLLGADSDTIPVREVTTWGEVELAGLTDGDTFASDLYYADLEADWDADGDGAFGEPNDGGDLRPDVALGRVPARTPAQVEAYTRKVYAYERWPVPDYQETALLMGEWAADLGGLEVYSSGALETAILPLFPEEWEVTRMYEDWEDWSEALPNDPETQRDVFAEGRNLALNFGHGAPSWLAGLDTDDLWSLDDPARPMVFVTTECSGCAFDEAVPEHVACEAFVLADGGGVAYLGNTTIGIGFPSLMNLYGVLFERFFDGRQLTLGERVVEAQREFTADASLQSEGNLDRWSMLAMVLAGDPALVPWTATPRQAEVEVRRHRDGGWRIACVAVRQGGTPVPGARVALRDPGGFLLAGDTDPTGDACFRLPEGARDWTVTVSGASLVPVQVEDWG